MMILKRLRAYANKAPILARVQLDKWTRTQWPQPRPSGASSRVAVAFVSYNTAELTAHLLFSLFRILGREQLARVVAVDNASIDGSRELLGAFHRRGLIDLVANEAQHYHGPGLNQAINHLAVVRESDATDPFDYIWVLDSDVLVLSKDAYVAARDFLETQRAAAVGEFQYDEFEDGYAHVSSLLIDPSKTWRGPVDPFDNSGSPAKQFHISVRRHGMRIGDFPFRSRNYVLHLGRGTVMTVVASGDASNQHYADAKKYNRTSYHFHGNENGELIYSKFLSVFRREVGEGYDPAALVEACEKPELLSLVL